MSAPAWARAPSPRLPLRRPALVVTGADVRLLLRLAAFVPLALFGLVQWAALVHPAVTGRAWATVLAGVAAAFVLLGLRDVGRRARLQIEALLGTPVYLDLHVKIAKDWQRDPRQLRKLGF